MSLSSRLVKLLRPAAKPSSPSPSASVSPALPRRGVLAKMASSVKPSALSRLVLAECKAIGNHGESPLENVRPPIPVAPGVSGLCVPDSTLWTGPRPAGQAGNTVSVLHVALPLDVDNLLTGDVSRLRLVHEFIHRYDFLEFCGDSLKVGTFHNVQYMAIELLIQYHDPFLGAFEHQQLLEEDELNDYGLRRELLEAAVESIKEHRENKFIELLSTIDYAQEHYG